MDKLIERIESLNIFELKFILLNKLLQDTNNINIVKNFLQCYDECRERYSKYGIMPINIRNDANVVPPTRSGISAGHDLYLLSDIELSYNKITSIPTKLSLGGSLLLQNNVYGFVTSRSSSAAKQIIVINGIVDPDYTGDIFIHAYTINENGVKLKKGDKIAQMIIQQFIPCKFEKDSKNVIQGLETIAAETRGERCLGSSDGAKI